MTNVYAIPSKEATRREMSVDEIVSEISNLLLSTSTVTLATDYFWFCPGKISPHIGKILNISTCYNDNFSETDLLSCLSSSGFKVTPVFGQDSYYWITKKNVYAIPATKITRRDLSVNEIVSEISNLLLSTSTVTLATDYFWFCPGKISPHIGKILNISTCYNDNFSETDLLSCLSSSGFKVTPVFGQDSYYWITKI